MTAVEIKFRSRRHEIIHESANTFKRATDAPANPFITDILFHLHIYCIVTENRHGRKPPGRADAPSKSELIYCSLFPKFHESEGSSFGMYPMDATEILKLTRCR
jgi:hypothetical protein